MAGSREVEASIVSRLIVVVVTIAVGLYFGYIAPSNPMFAGALIVGFFLVFLLVTRPHVFVVLLVFFLFEMFGLANVDTFGRLPGLFRAKDVLLFLLVGYTAAGAAMGLRPARPFRDSKLFVPLMAFLGFVVFQMFYTRTFHHERLSLLFRAGRHFLTYGVAFFLVLFFYDERRWRFLERWLFVFVFGVFFLNLLEMAGVPVPFYFWRGTFDFGVVGAVKFANAAGPLTYWLFARCFWEFCYKPERKNTVLLALLGLVLLTYSYRAYWAGLAVGLLITWFMAPPRAKFRAAVVVAGAVVVGGLLTVFAVAAASSVSMAAAAKRLWEFAAGTVTDLVLVQGSYASRAVMDAMRIPLVKAHPFMGMGFVSVFGDVAYDLWMRGDLPVGTIDTGWIDLMLRLGGIGSTMLLLLFLRVIQVNWQLNRDPAASVSDHAVYLGNVTFVVLATVSLVAAALPSWEAGITTLSLIMALTMCHEFRRLQRKQNEAGSPASLDGAGDAKTPPLRGMMGM